MKSDLNNKSDKEIVEEFTEKNNREAFGIIYERYFGMVYKYVFMRVGNRSYAEDIVSETFLTLIDIVKKYDGKCKLSTFIIGIAVNKTRQYWQKLSLQKSTDIDEELFIFDEEVTDNSSDKITKLAKHLGVILDELPDNYRDVLTERFINSRSIKDTAKVLNMTEGNVRVVQNRAIKKAREIIGKLKIINYQP